MWASGRLDEQHGLSQFDCGVTSLNQWLSGRAREAQARGTAATYVWTAVGTSRVVAYYAIAPSGAVGTGDVGNGRRHHRDPRLPAGAAGP